MIECDCIYSYICDKMMLHVEIRGVKYKFYTRARLVHYNDYCNGIGISITMNTLSWNVISITIH